MRRVPASELADSCVQPNPVPCVQLEVGGVSLRFTGIGLSERNVGPVLGQFRVAGGASDIDIHIDWATRLVANLGLPLFDSGTTWRLYDNRDGFQFDFSSPIFGEQPYKRLIVDRCFRRAILHVSQESLTQFPSTASPLEYPLDELLIMHRLTQEKAIELHGSGIVRPDGTGNLFVGHSGAGKSTTTRLWTACEEVEVLSDDRIIVRRDDNSAPMHQAKTQVPRSARDDRGKNKMRMYGTPWHGEAMYASPNSAPLTRIFILEHGHGNVLTRLSPSQAVAELFARSFVPFHRHEYVESALTFLQEVVDAVPVYRYSFEPDQRAVETILNFSD